MCLLARRFVPAPEEAARRLAYWKRTTVRTTSSNSSNNPQHRQILVNEIVAGSILTHLQISSPDWQFIALSSEFLDRNPEICHSPPQLSSTMMEVEPGWHFGSRHPGNPDTMAIYDFIPDALLSQVANAEQFRAVLVFDRWVANADGRQAVFLGLVSPQDWLAELRACCITFAQTYSSMIDHGFAGTPGIRQFVHYGDLSRGLVL